MARAVDEAGIHFRVLNGSKGPAVRATRAQADRSRYRTAVRRIVENQPGLSLLQQSVDDLIIENGQGRGLFLPASALQFAPAPWCSPREPFSPAISMSALRTPQAAAPGDPPSIALARRLRELPFRVARLKTGTPPRLDRQKPRFFGDAGPAGR